jgi:hypothetical protein
VEISTNDGATWADLGPSLTPGYTGTLFNASGNPLGGHQAYAGLSAGYPGLLTTTANLGTAYQGMTVRIRFRIATDAGVGAMGWEIGSVSFTNITNQPFLALGPNAVDCTPLAVDPPRPRQVSLAVTGANPAGARAHFRFGLPEAGRVELAVYDVTGRRVATLERRDVPSGWHESTWSANDDGGPPASGVYFARLAARGRVLCSRVVMIR